MFPGKEEMTCNTGTAIAALTELIEMAQGQGRVFVL